MEQKILLPRQQSLWAELNSLEIYQAVSNNKLDIFKDEIKPDQSVSVRADTYIVGKYGWLHYYYEAKAIEEDTKQEWLQDSEEYEKILQSGKVGKWYGQGPWTRGTFCRVPENYQDNLVYKIVFEYADPFLKELHEMGFKGMNDVVTLLINNPGSKKESLTPIPVQFASLYCPDWDDYHPIVLEWLKEWQDAVSLEEKTGFNYMLDIW